MPFDVKQLNLTYEEIDLIISYVDSDIDDDSAEELSDDEKAQVLGLLESNPDASIYARELQTDLQHVYFVSGRTNDTTPTLSEYAAWADDCRAQNEGL